MMFDTSENRGNQIAWLTLLPGVELSTRLLSRVISVYKGSPSIVLDTIIIFIIHVED